MGGLLRTPVREELPDLAWNNPAHIWWLPKPQGTKTSKLRFVDPDDKAVVTQTVPKAGYAVQFVSLEESPTEYDNIPGHLVFAKNQPIYVWNESGEADAKLWFEDSEGRAWMEGWIGHSSEKPLYRGDGG